jgi:membrane fusion protein (multidrug efflux system)
LAGSILRKQLKRAGMLLMLASGLSAFELPITGTVISYNQKMIGPRYMGYVKHVYYDIGDHVNRDDTLFELESAEFDILKEQADLALEQANAIVDVYRTRLNSIKREKKLFKSRGFGSKDDYEALDTAAENTSAGLASAQVLVKNAAEKIKQISTVTGYLEVKAPNSGIVVEKRIRVGDMVTPGMLGMIIVDLEHLRVEGEIGETDLQYVHKYQRVKIKIPAIKYETIGYIKSVVPSANPMAHTFKVIVNFEKNRDDIFPGMYAKIILNVDKSKIAKD